MNAQTKMEPPTLAKLRDPFPPGHVSKLPKESRAQIDARKADRNTAINCKVCGGWHHKNAVHLDYVGHAALTDRLLDTDPHWTWEPVSFGQDGLPAFDQNKGLWIKLTVLGVTRLGYGSADGKTGGDAVKEIIGDALRNAAMRFGAALDLWHKGDLHAEDGALEGADQGQSKGEPRAVSPDGPTDYTPPTPIAGETVVTDYAFPAGPATGITQLKAMARSLWREIEGCGDDSELDALLGTADAKATMKQLAELENPEHLKIWLGDGADNPGLSGLIIRKQAEFNSALGPNILQAG